MKKDIKIGMLSVIMKGIIQHIHVQYAVLVNLTIIVSLVIAVLERFLVILLLLVKNISVLRRAQELIMWEVKVIFVILL